MNDSIFYKSIIYPTGFRDPEYHLVYCVVGRLNGGVKLSSHFLQMSTHLKNNITPVNINIK